jgi:hypothetical protein
MLKPRVHKRRGHAEVKDAGKSQTLSEQIKSFIIELSDSTESLANHVIRTQVVDLIRTSVDIYDFIVKSPAAERGLLDFADYYFPSALKLVGEYIELKNKGYISDYKTDTLQRIKSALDIIVDVFHDELEKLFKIKGAGIKTDIAVLETVLRREGFR